MSTTTALKIRRDPRHDRWASTTAAHLVRTDLADTLVDFWIRSRPASGLPDREGFDAENLRPWIGYLSIYEFLGACSDYRNRLEGTEVVDLTGENWQGRLASEVDGHFGLGFLADLRRTAVWRYPMRSLCQVFQRPYQLAERVLLPVTVNGTAVDQIFMALFPANRDVQ